MSTGELIFNGGALVGLLWLTWKIGHDGLPAVWRKAKTLFGRGIAEAKQIAADVEDLRGEVERLKSRAAQIEAKLGLAAPERAAVPAPAPQPTKPA